MMKVSFNSARDVQYVLNSHPATIPGAFLAYADASIHKWSFIVQVLHFPGSHFPVLHFPVRYFLILHFRVSYCNL